MALREKRIELKDTLLRIIHPPADEDSPNSGWINLQIQINSI